MLKLKVSIPNRDFGKFQLLKKFAIVFRVLLFQSLIGILVSFNCLIVCGAGKGSVSIPNRDFGKFQLKINRHLGIFLAVSIPNRDFGKFQHNFLKECWYCNLVSIPNRDFGKFQRNRLPVVNLPFSSFNP